MNPTPFPACFSGSIFYSTLKVKVFYYTRATHCICAQPSDCKILNLWPPKNNLKRRINWECPICSICPCLFNNHIKDKVNVRTFFLYKNRHNDYLNAFLSATLLSFVHHEKPMARNCDRGANCVLLSQLQWSPFSGHSSKHSPSSN